MLSHTGEHDSCGRVYVSPPYQSVDVGTSGVMGVWISPYEEVEWLWEHGPNGSRVTGYNVKTKIPKEALNDR